MPAESKGGTQRPIVRDSGPEGPSVSGSAPRVAETSSGALLVRLRELEEAEPLFLRALAIQNGGEYVDRGN